MSNTYGTVGSERHAQPNGPTDASEEGPLLGGHAKSSSSSIARLRKHMNAPVSKSWADLVLLAGYTITGLLDSASISIWNVFVSMQTGNSIYLGLGLSNPSASTKWIKSLISIAAFCLGSFLFAFLHRHFGGRRRYTLVTSYTLQLLCIVGSALIVEFGPPTPPTEGPAESKSLTWVVVLPLVLLAFQSSGQAITSRVLSYNGLTSVVLTSNYCDLFADPELFTAGLTKNVVRNRRAAAPLLLLVGAVAGGVLARSGAGLAAALWAAAAVKLVIVGAWCLWKADEEEEEG